MEVQGVGWWIVEVWGGEVPPLLQYQASIGGVGQPTDLILAGHIFLYNTEQIEKLVAVKRFQTILIKVKK